MWYGFEQGKSAAESHRVISEAFGKEASSESQCLRWFQHFKNGQTVTADIYKDQLNRVDQALRRQGNGLRPQASSAIQPKPGPIRSPFVPVDAALPG
uniref:HTH_48 domain-containing protein n=1 Tax=Haemonchus contortus TaxID=6289 RepID=A0A7I4YEM2_HAECO